MKLPKHKKEENKGSYSQLKTPACKNSNSLEKRETMLKSLLIISMMEKTAYGSVSQAQPQWNTKDTMVAAEVSKYRKNQQKKMEVICAKLDARVTRSFMLVSKLQVGTKGRQCVVSLDSLCKEAIKYLWMKL